MIIYDELQYCRDLLEIKVKRIFQRDLNYLAKFWVHEGLKRKEIENNLLQWCQKQDKNYNEILGIKRIRKAIQHANRYELRPIIPIVITETELNTIKTIEDYRLQKIIFIMLATARYFKYTETKIKPKTSAKLIGTYYNHNFIDSLKVANITMNIHERNEARNKLKILGLINPILFTNNPYKQEASYRLNFADETGIPVLKIEDWRNPIAYYQEYCGEKVIECKECGMKILKKGKNHSYCKNCWKSRNTKQTNKRVKKYRENCNVTFFENDNCDCSL